MSGETNRSATKVLIFLAVVVIAGITFWYLREIPAKYNLVDAIKNINVRSSEISVVVVGDIMLDRNVRNIIDRHGFDFFFKGVKKLISSVDIAVGNLEGPFTDNSSITASLKSKELVFTFNPTLAPYMKDLGFDILGLANNHTLNFGQTGLKQTRQYIGEAGMLYYGDPNNVREISIVTEKNGIRVGFIGFHEFTYSNLDKVIAEIDKLRLEVDVLIVSPHWGAEYEPIPVDSQRKLAKNFIDHGADAVIGTHSHVIGEIEEYNGKKIYYSLGNFAFDQYFSKATSEGLVVKMNIKKDSQKSIVINYENSIINIDREGVREL